MQSESAASSLPEHDYPPEVTRREWAGWSEESRYIYVERVNMGADAEIALEQARRNHKMESGRLF